MLRIPMPGEPTPPLTVSRVRSVEPESAHGQVAVQRIRRRKRRRAVEGPDWERSAGHHLGGGAERSASKWWLIGGGVGICAVVAVVAVLMKAMPQGSTNPHVSVNPVVPVAVESDGSGEVTGGGVLGLRSDAEFLRLAKPLAARFMAARTVDELLPLVRDREVVEPKIRAMHPDGLLTPYGYQKFNTQNAVESEGPIRSVAVANADFEEKFLAFEETKEGVLIDWESWAGWSEMTAKDFMATKPSVGKLFRVVLSPVDYYNFEFADEIRWRSYRLTLPDGETMLYGYAERGSAIDSKLRLPTEVEQAVFTLKLKYPEDSGPSNQVLVESVVADGWVVTNPKSP